MSEKPIPRSVLEDDSEFSAALGLIMGYWALVENALTILMGALLRLDEDRAKLVFMSFNSMRTKLDLMQRLTYIYIDECELREKVSEVLKRAVELNIERNKFVHAVWAVRSGDEGMFLRMEGSLQGSKTAPYKAAKRHTTADVRSVVAAMANLEADVHRVRSDLEREKIVRERPVHDLYPGVAP